ncbi:MAG: M20/M25/M40 family metallo-hydrolase [Candidatus Poribacteria bacterium]|nr:M20/M25/M40 family metallo-hydrolase [Candidatus Poribacteria bacterium]
MNLVIENRIVDEIFANSEAYENLLVLADDIGPRLIGSPNEIKARDFLIETLSQYGLDNVRAEAFPHQAWRAEREELRIIAPIERKLGCRCSALSASTPTVGVEGEFVLLERCDRAELEEHKERVKGRIVVAPYDPVPRHLKTPLATEYGAIALLEAFGFPGSHLSARACVYAKAAQIPVASISKEDHDFLRRLEQRKGTAKLRLTLDSRFEKKDGWNVVGEISGTEDTPEHIVMGAHYDSHHIAPGAADNAAGVAAIVEAARALIQNQEHIKRSIIVALFSGEEVGLVGAWAYTHQHCDELENTILMLNNDGQGGRPNGVSINAIDEFKPIMEDVSVRFRIDGEDLPPYKVSVDRPGWYGVDQFPFFLNGVPAMLAHTSPYHPNDFAFVHTTADTVDKVYVPGLTESAAVNAQIAFNFANLPARPAPRKTQQELEEMFENYDYIETLELLDMWPAEHAKERYFSFN